MISEVDWVKIVDWIHDTSSTVVHTDELRQPYIDLVCRICHEYIIQETDRTFFQLYAVSIIFVVSCFASDFPARLDDMESMCGYAYTQNQILTQVYSVLQWLVPPPDNMTISGKETIPLYQNMETVCTLVCTLDGRRLVRKTIQHDAQRLPMYHGVTEIVADYLMRSRGKQHPNVVSLVTLAVCPQELSLYSDYIPETFGSAIAPSAILGLLEGVAAMHSAGISHRDLKPENIRHEDASGMILIDLGAAGFGRHRNTIPVCTITHRSPDLLEAEITGRAYCYDGYALDMWSLGILLVEWYTRSKPFGCVTSETTALEMLQQIQRGMPDVVSRVRNVLGDGLFSRSILRCLGPPSHRPTVQELIHAFQNE
jgi:hypothetical protein